jgi:hypothetical protein
MERAFVIEKDGATGSAETRESASVRRLEVRWVLFMPPSTRASHIKTGPGSADATKLGGDKIK